MSQYLAEKNVKGLKVIKYGGVWVKEGRRRQLDEEECRTSGAEPGAKLKPSPTLLSKVSF